MIKPPCHNNAINHAQATITLWGRHVPKGMIQYNRLEPTPLAGYLPQQSPQKFKLHSGSQLHTTTVLHLPAHN
jgi:hypothetical protein